MLNPDFYPTPKAVIKKMLSPYMDNIEHRKILEPSAGKGDIVDYILANHPSYRHKEIFIKCCEYDPDLIATLQGKKYQVVSSDFLKYVPSHYFDLIVMNPPFANGVDHLLHAWEILQSGDIVCLLNAETIRNPHTEKRKLLKRIIEDNKGTVEFLGNVFSMAERKTDVDVALVRLHKEPDSDSFFAKPVNKERIESVRPDVKTEIAIKDDLGAMIQAFEAAKRSFASVWKSRAEVENYLSPIGGLTSHYDSSRRIDFLSYACEMKNPIDAYNFFVEEMRKNAWNTVFNRVGVQERVTEKVRKDFEKLRTENGFDFTKENVEALLDGLVLNKGKIMQDCINEAFDLMTAYHKENRIHIEGWVTNDRWMVNRKVILPYMVETRWDGRGFKARYGYTDASRILDDIDKAMCFLSGKGFDARDENGKRTFLRIADAIEIAQNSESEFFYLKSHLKGTLHLTFKDENLWKRFNAAACEGKNWLPGKK